MTGFVLITLFGVARIFQATGGALILLALVQGGIDVRSGWSIYGHPYFLKYLPRALNPEGRTCLIVGLGAGIVPKWYEAQGVRTDVLDIDPNVVAAARTFFGYRPGGEVYTADARHFLRSSRKTYDYIVLDVFSGDTTPTHVLSREALEDARRRLAPGGILAVNVIGRLEGDSYITASILETFRQVFPAVRCYPAYDRAKSEYGNIIVVASTGELPELDREKLAAGYVHPLAADAVKGTIGKTFLFPPGTPAIVLTDDYNPVDFYDLRIKEALRVDILKYTEADILL